MKQNRIIGILLIILALLVIAGFMLKSDTYWFSLDIIMILTCGASGSILLGQK